MQEENMKSLAKTFDILELFLEGYNNLSVTEISKILNLNKTTVSRILSKLTKRGYLRQVEKRGKFVLGTIFIKYGETVRQQFVVRQVAMPFLSELSRLVKEFVIVSIWDRREYVETEMFYDQSPNESRLQIIPGAGTSLPLYCTCLGKIMLADMSEDEFTAYFQKNPLKKHTQKTILDIACIKKQMVDIRREGVAMDDEETDIGIRGIASGIKDISGKIIGSIGILAPSSRQSCNQMLEFAPVLKEYADKISRQLGYNAHTPL